MQPEELCGVSCWHPRWLQSFATTKIFLAVYGLLGTIQSMSYMYFIVTLTTIEKRFKIPSQTTGIVLSGNEISQILLSLFLSYIAGQRNRPRWIAWGVVFCGLSCFILAMPHFIYGAGEEALQLTKEYGDNLKKNFSYVLGHDLCFTNQSTTECDELVTIIPLVLIFLSQFVLGIGNTLYYSLGQPYIDDNTKKSNTPLMLSFAMALRLIGPVVGFQLGFASLNMFIDPTKHPLIDRNDPRWLGAWWFGWIILGSVMIIFSGLVGLFPKKMPNKSKHQKKKFHSEMPKALIKENLNKSDDMNYVYHSTLKLNQTALSSTLEFPKLKDFPVALIRLLKNKLLMLNIASSIFYILGASGFMTFLAKYMEVQFQKTAQNATVLIGPVTIIGMVIGLILSGFILSKKRPSSRKVLFWNIIVGFIFLAGQTSYFYLYCGDTNSMIRNGRLHVSKPCNSNCSCDQVPYSPVCQEYSGTTFFSPCHAGCNVWNSTSKVYSNCSCLLKEKLSSSKVSASYLTDNSTIFQTSTQINMDVMLNTINIPDSSKQKRPIHDLHENNKESSLLPGACLKGCAFAFYAFAAISMTINMFGSSGRIGNLLVNYRAVSTEDKSFAQGLALMLVSLFALIPGPIIFGWIIDQTCLVWTQHCNQRGHCQLYDQKNFRYYVNSVALALTTVGVILDILVWYYGRNLDLYGEREQQRIQEVQRKNRTITPLLQ